MSECCLCLTDYHSKQFIHTCCCKQKFCVNCALKLIKISDIGLPYFDNCPFCRDKFFICLNQLTNWNKPQLLNLIKIYSDKPSTIIFHNTSASDIADNDIDDEIEHMGQEDLVMLENANYADSVITNISGTWRNMIGQIVNPPQPIEDTDE
tara:strand:+ start:688 stop:1140 length:453 start_codon:yes stop_codon:yes gene_type:complete